MKRILSASNARNEMSPLRITLRRKRRTSATHRSTNLTRTMRRHCGLWVSLTTNINYKHMRQMLPAAFPLQKNSNVKRRKQSKNVRKSETRHCVTLLSKL